MKQVTIHIGAHRSASTAIQDLLRTQRAELKAAGVALFLRADMDKAGAPDPRRLHWRQGWLARRRVARLHAALQSVPEPRILMSEENLMGTMPGVLDRRFYPHFENLVQALATLRRWFDIHPRMVVRRQDRFLESVYAFRVGQGLVEDFETFVKSFGAERVSWLRLVRAFDDVKFASARILPLENLPESGQDAALADFLCLGDVLGATGARPHGNRSFSGAALRLLLALNRSGLAPDRKWRRQALFPLLWRSGKDAPLQALEDAGLDLSSGQRTALSDAMNGDVPLGFDRDARQAFLGSYAEENAIVLSHPFVAGQAGIWRL